MTGMLNDEVLAVIQSKLDEAQAKVSAHLTIPMQLAKVCPALKTVKTFCPVCDRSRGYYPLSLSSLIQELNDGHQWTREQIADFLESLNVDLTIRKDTNA